MIQELRKKLELSLQNNSPDLLPTIHEGKQFLSFRVFQQELLVAVDDIREIIMPPPIAFVPRGPTELEGVIALRGEILPVVNLRRLLGFTQGVLSATTRVLIVRPDGDDFALVVDEITEFVWLQEQQIAPLGHEYLTDEFKVVSGVAKRENAVTPILDIARVQWCVFTEGESHGKKAVKIAS